MRKPKDKPLPPGHYTVTLLKIRKVRNKDQLKLTFQIKDPPDA